MTKELAFEEAYSRLEEILEKLNIGSVSLETSISLYEEADKLIKLCSTRLDTAEQKILKLIKTQNQTVSIGKDGNPQTEAFITDSDQVLKR